MPAVFIDAKSAGAVKSSLRRMLKKPDTIQSIERITPAEHKKSLRARLKGDEEGEVEEEIEMTETSKDLISMVEKELSTRARDNLSASDFVFPDERSYPIQDESHARNALARVAQHGTPAQKAKVKAAVRRKYPNIKVDEEVEMNEKDSRRTVDAIRAYDKSKDASRDADWDTEHGKKGKGDKEKKYAKKERGEIDKDDPDWKHKKGHTGMHGEDVEKKRSPGDEALLAKARKRIAQDKRERATERLPAPKSEETEISPLMKATLDELSKNTLGSYIRKAAVDKGNASIELGRTAGSGKQTHADVKKYAGKAVKRGAGISKAVGKLVKDDVEIDEASKIRNNLQMISDIAKNKQAGHITHSGKKTQVDMFTASAVQQVYNVLNKQNQQKMEKMINKDRAGFLKVAKFALSKAR